MNRTRTITGLLLVASLAIGACGTDESQATSSGPVELTPVSIQMYFLPEPGWGWHLYGIEHGIYAKHGIELDLIPGQGSNFTMQQLNENQVQFGQASLLAYLANRAEVGSETMVVYTPIDHPQAGILTTVPADSLDDLDGTTIGMIPFTVLRNLLPIVLQENGLEPDSIQIETMSTSLGLLFEGTVDSIEGFLGGNVASNLHLAEEAGVDIYHLDLNDFGLEGYAHPLIVHNDVIENDPDLVRRLVAAMKESANAALEATPEEIAELVHAHAPEIAEEVVVLDWPDYRELITESGLIESEVVEVNLGYVRDALGIAHDLQAEDMFTNEFVPTD
ncbi:MAG: ABC transporter substrate-binding protein [Acidimicrobiia bacterium]